MDISELCWDGKHVFPEAVGPCQCGRRTLVTEPEYRYDRSKSIYDKHHRGEHHDNRYPTA